MSSSVLVCAALRIEAHAARSVLPTTPVVRIGMRARLVPASIDIQQKSARRMGILGTEGRDSDHSTPVVLIGFGGSLDPAINVGDVVVASRIETGNRAIYCAGSAALGAILSDLGPQVHVAPITSSSRIVYGVERNRLAAITGAVAVDMESAVLGSYLGERPFAVVRVIVDTPHRRLIRTSLITDGIWAYRTLRDIALALPGWASHIDGATQVDWATRIEQPNAFTTQAITLEKKVS